MSNRRGFTLIELMLVVVVIGILTAMAIPRFNITAHQSKEKEADILLKQVLVMQRAYIAQKGHPAVTADSLMQVGFEQPQTQGLRYYSWTPDQNVQLPLCLATNPPGSPWRGRQIDADGIISNC